MAERAPSFASTASVRNRMQRQARKDTGCELLLRRALHARGLRYRVHRRVLPDLRREADLVFRGARVAVFVDGCFWHGCQRHRTPSITNSAWWAAKIARNVERDAQTSALLTSAGWSVVRVWEHADAVRAAEVVANIVRARRRPRVVVVD